MDRGDRERLASFAVLQLLQMALEPRGLLDVKKPEIPVPVIGIEGTDCRRALRRAWLSGDRPLMINAIFTVSSKTDACSPCRPEAVTAGIQTRP